MTSDGIIHAPETEADLFPLPCSWCSNSPGTHWLVYDYRVNGKSSRFQQLLCGPCAHQTTVLSPNCIAWWLFELAPDRCEEGPLTEDQRFQVQQARDILGTWELARDPDAPFLDREAVLADQVRTLLAIIDEVAPKGDR